MSPNTLGKIDLSLVTLKKVARGVWKLTKVAYLTTLGVYKYRLGSSSDVDLWASQQLQFVDIRSFARLISLGTAGELGPKTKQEQEMVKQLHNTDSVQTD